MVRSKMICCEMKEFDAHEGPNFEVRFFPVSAKEGENIENAAFFAATPGGDLRLSGLKSNHGFEVGKEYYVDIHRAVQPEQVQPERTQPELEPVEPSTDPE